MNIRVPTPTFLLFVVAYVHRTLTVHDFAFLPLPLRFRRTLTIVKSPTLRPSSSLTCTVFNDVHKLAVGEPSDMHTSITPPGTDALISEVSRGRAECAWPNQGLPLEGRRRPKSLCLKSSPTQATQIILRVAIESSHSLLPENIYFYQGSLNSFSDIGWLPFFTIS